MVVMTYFLLEQWKKVIRRRQFVASTIVSTPMVQKMAQLMDSIQKPLPDLNGLVNWSKISLPRIYRSGEESFGYLVGDAFETKTRLLPHYWHAKWELMQKTTTKVFMKSWLNVTESLALTRKLISFTQKEKKGRQNKAMMEGIEITLPKKLAE